MGWGRRLLNAPFPLLFTGPAYLSLSKRTGQASSVKPPFFWGIHYTHTLGLRLAYMLKYSLLSFPAAILHFLIALRSCRNFHLLSQAVKTDNGKLQLVMCKRTLLLVL